MLEFSNYYELTPSKLITYVRRQKPRILVPCSVAYSFAIDMCPNIDPLVSTPKLMFSPKEAKGYTHFKQHVDMQPWSPLIDS